jgi:hypothetical protein
MGVNMGSDDLFKKRKAKSKDLQRRKPVIASYDKILIVCEGEKTEPQYFQELVDHYEIHSANVKISGECGSDPLSVVTHGLDLYQNEKDADSGAFDRVFCVFDRDAHPNYQAAVQKVQGQKLKDVFFAITSVPSFEYWFLLHYDYTTAPYSAVGGTSSGAAVVAALKKFWTDYTKGANGTFEHLLNLRNDELGYAKANARRGLLEAQRNGTDDPTTKVHELVDYLQVIKSGRL